MNQLIIDFIERAVTSGLLDEVDRIYTTNQLLHLIGQDGYDDSVSPSTPLPEMDTIVEKLLTEAMHSGVIGDTLYEREELEAAVMNLVTPLPSVVNRTFWAHHASSPKAATDYFYQLSQSNHYIQTQAIAKNIHFPYQGKYGTLEITINLSKPEKDPKAIALAKQSSASVTYPASQLTMTNEGYYGRHNHPARSNHRIARLMLNGEPWGFQYSPYSYFNEHSIFLTQTVRPMKVDERCFANLIAVLEQFPHYFVGSNAGLPIVGGSILVHDHYQAGRHLFPMDHAQVLKTYHVDAFDGEIQLLHWPLSVLRLVSNHPEQLLHMASRILQAWEHYSDSSVGILAHTENTPHNAITPIARIRDGHYELNLTLRNNRTSQEYPDGIFHPHPDVQPIKKENIGLIEVMGLAILPPRLKGELAAVEDYLLGKDNDIPSIHQEWADALANRVTITDATVHDLVQQEVGRIFERVLEDAGVFKQTPEGIAAFERFVTTSLSAREDD